MASSSAVRPLDWETSGGSESPRRTRQRHGQSRPVVELHQEEFVFGVGGPEELRRGLPRLAKLLAHAAADVEDQPDGNRGVVGREWVIDCSTLSSMTRKCSRSSPVKGRFRGSVTVTGTITRVLSTRMFERAGARPGAPAWGTAGFRRSAPRRGRRAGGPGSG